MKRLSRGQWATIIVLVVLLIDQCVKFIVKTNMYIGESIDVTSWFKIAFIENNGAAFGMELGSKLFLSIFRVIASGVLGYALWYICRRPQYSMGSGIFLTQFPHRCCTHFPLYPSQGSSAAVKFGEARRGLMLSHCQSRRLLNRVELQSF